MNDELEACQDTLDVKEDELTALKAQHAALVGELEATQKDHDTLIGKLFEKKVHMDVLTMVHDERGTRHAALVESVEIFMASSTRGGTCNNKQQAVFFSDLADLGAAYAVAQEDE